MSTRWAGTALCTLAVALAALAGSLAAGEPAQARQLHQSDLQAQSSPPLTLVQQTPWVTPAQPWFNITFGVSPAAGPVSSLHVNLTFYGRLDNTSELQQAENGSPSTGALLHDDVAVSAIPGGLSATACVTVLPEDSATAPAGGLGMCPAGAPTLVLGCTPLNGTCPDVYPVTASLVRQGATSSVARFTTFLTYDEPEGPRGGTGSLRVGLVVPINRGGMTSLAGALTEHRDVATTLAVSPVAVSDAAPRATARTSARWINSKHWRTTR